MEIVQITNETSNKCFVCGKHFKPFRLIKNKDGLQEVEFVFNDAKCRNLLNRRDELIDELMSVEHELKERRK
jgi:hypothetical protein